MSEAQILQDVRNYVQIHSSIEKLKLAMIEIANINVKNDCKEFDHDIEGKNWHGFLYRVHNKLYGSIFSLYGGTPVIVRGFPKMNYILEILGAPQIPTEKILLEQKDVVFERKIDGCNITTWWFPDGSFMGKTRESERYDKKEGGYAGQKWHKLVEETGLLENLKQLCASGFQASFELYGWKVPQDFIRYTVPVAISILEIADRKTFYYVPYDTKVALCEKFGLPYPDNMFRGNSTLEKIKSLTIEAKKYMVPDGAEGFVAKWFNPKTQDIVMGKIKCKEILELSYLMSPKSKIPNLAIAKAVRKARENMVDLGSSEAVEFVRDELLEEFESKFIEISMEKIRVVLMQNKEVIENLKANLAHVFDYFEKLKIEGIEVSFSNKNQILRLTNQQFPDLESRQLYSAFELFTGGLKNDSKD